MHSGNEFLSVSRCHPLHPLPLSSCAWRSIPSPLILYLSALMQQPSVLLCFMHGIHSLLPEPLLPFRGIRSLPSLFPLIRAPASRCFDCCCQRLLRNRQAAKNDPLIGRREGTKLDRSQPRSSGTAFPGAHAATRRANYSFSENKGYQKFHPLLKNPESDGKQEFVNPFGISAFCCYPLIFKTRSLCLISANLSKKKDYLWHLS